jgi:RIO kinase 1
MRQPESLAPLVDQGIIQEVVRPLMSGKEAQIYLVVSGDALRVAKVYKAAQDRSFRQRAAYTEGRAVRNTRTQRAISKHSRYGRAQDEASWRSAEVDIIYRLRAAGVPVPEPFNYCDGVLVMELITDGNGEPAPRLADVDLGRDQAGEIFKALLSAAVKMLCAGVVHGDLSEFNVLLGAQGPVVIDFPQAVDPAQNQNARKLLIRDLDNLSLFLARAAPGQRRLPYGQELWDLYARSELTPETVLTGRYRAPERKADTTAVLREIESAAREAERRREAEGPRPGRRGRGPKTPQRPAPVVMAKPNPRAPAPAPISAPAATARSTPRAPAATPPPAPVTARSTRAPTATPPPPPVTAGEAERSRTEPKPASGARRRRRRRRRTSSAGNTSS